MKVLSKFLSVLAMMLFCTVMASAQEIQVGGTATIKKKPELASFDIDVQGRGKSGNLAQDEMLKALTAVQDRVKTIGSLEVTSRGYRVRPETATRRNARGFDEVIVVGFIATTSYRVKVTDLSKLPRALEMTSLPGISRASALGFDLRDRQSVIREARAAALEDAKSNALNLAKSMGSSGFDLVKLQQYEVNFRDMFGELTLPMDSIKNGGRVVGEDEYGAAPMMALGSAAGLSAQMSFSDLVIMPDDMEITASVVMSVKIK